ncbi:MAG TPA: glutamate formimidoyltransferase, partial [Candidatus Limnocylindria bacterium]|nr:glutamate formimidoyltransferase [Candidatus Limnocylindria bacterium]
DHNRSGFTAGGEPDALQGARVRALGVALSRIDLRSQRGGHPRMGAADVIPFIPIRGCSMDDAVRLSRALGGELADRFGLPVYLYERSASAPHRANLADVRRGGFEGMAEKMRDPLWLPDFGPSSPHPSGGASAVGARMPLVAFNVNLDTDDLGVAQAVARAVRESGGGLPRLKALGVMLHEQGCAQVSMNLTDYTVTGLAQAFEAVRSEAARLGAGVANSEIIGLVPLEALADAAAHFLRLPGFSKNSVLESRMYEGEQDGTAECDPR